MEELGIKEYLPAYLDPNLKPSDLPTGVCFASGASGYDPLTPKIAVCVHKHTLLIIIWFLFIYIANNDEFCGEKK